MIRYKTKTKIKPGLTRQGFRPRTRALEAGILTSGPPRVVEVGEKDGMKAKPFCLLFCSVLCIAELKRVYYQTSSSAHLHSSARTMTFFISLLFDVIVRIRQAIGPYEDLLTTVKKRKLRWYGHKTRSSGLAKMILQGTVQGGRRRGRQKKRWEDNITEWTGLKLGEALRKAENREEWRTVVARSSLVPQRSNRLWDK